MYKIISKTLASHLSKVLESFISKSQSSFLLGRQILDGVAILNEVIDEAKKKKMNGIFFKVDFKKAYNSIDWGYLDEMMMGLKFGVHWRN